MYAVRLDAVASTSNGPTSTTASLGKPSDLIDPDLSLSSHMQSLLESSLFCDAVVTSGAEAMGITGTDKPSGAHQALLSCRSRYFKSLFGPGLSTGAVPEDVEVESPDPPATVSRMLSYLYTGVLPPGTCDQLLQDLVTCDRFGMAHMKSLCENAVTITIGNAARLFELGDLLAARRLREVHYCTMSCLNVCKRCEVWVYVTSVCV